MTGPVLLLGGTGFLGRHLGDALHGLGIATVSAGRTNAPVTVDLTDPDATGRMLDDVRPGVLVHLACGLRPGSDVADYRRERARLIDPTYHLILDCARRGIDLVFVSSGGTVYGATTHATCREQDPLHPISFYGQSKVELETFIEFAARTHGLRHLIVRPSNPYGPHQVATGTQGLIAVAFGRLIQDDPLDVWGDGQALRDYIDVRDLSAALAALIAAPVRGETINIGSGEGHSLLDVAALIGRTAGKALRLRFQPARVGDVPRVVLDTARLRRLIGFAPRPLARGVNEYFEHLQETGQWPASR